MSAAPVMSITDELVAELEASASYCVTEVIRSHSWSEQEFDLLRADERYVRAASPELVVALLAERAELERNDERLQFVISEGITISSMNGTGRPMVYQCQWHDCRQIDWYASPTEAIDAAMQAAQ